MISIRVESVPGRCKVHGTSLIRTGSSHQETELRAQDWGSRRVSGEGWLQEQQKDHQALHLCLLGKKAQFSSLGENRLVLHLSGSTEAFSKLCLLQCPLLGRIKALLVRWHPKELGVEANTLQQRSRAKQGEERDFLTCSCVQ